MAGRDDSELDKAVEDWRGEGVAQLALLDDDAVSVPGAPRAKGRPPGSRNLRSEAYAALLRGRHGDPLDVATKIAAIDVTEEANIAHLAKLWGCKRFEAVKLWAQINRDVQSYHHQQMPRALIFAPGDPRLGDDGRVLVEVDGVFSEIADDEAGT